MKRSSPDRSRSSAPEKAAAFCCLKQAGGLYRGGTPEDLTLQELLELVQRHEGEFIIRIEPGEEETDAGTL